MMRTSQDDEDILSARSWRSSWAARDALDAGVRIIWYFGEGGGLLRRFEAPRAPQSAVGRWQWILNSNSSQKTRDCDRAGA